MHWIYLLVAGVFEIGFTTALKLSDNFTKRHRQSDSSFWGQSRSMS